MINENFLIFFFWTIEVILLLGIIIGFLLCLFYCCQLVFAKIKKEIPNDKLKIYKKRAKIYFIVMIVSFILEWFAIMMGFAILGE